MSYRMCCLRIFCLLALLNAACRQVYEPPAISSPNHFLVVDGTILNGQDSTVIKLSHSRNFSDTSSFAPELNAQVTVAGEAGDNFPLFDQGGGAYVTSQLNLNNNERYQLKISTSDGKQYESALSPVLQTPPIDSITWRQDSIGVSIYAYAHDATGNIKYYRWSYTETWEYHTDFDSYFDYVNGQVVQRAPDAHVYKCWSSFNSTNLVLTSTAKLSQDVIYQLPITSIPRSDEKLSDRYSIIVNEYGLDVDAYNYWLNLQKNTEQLGSLFDAQPSEVTGNVTCITNPAEPVLGYVSVSTGQHYRIFIDNSQLFFWNYEPYYAGAFCEIKQTTADSADHYFPPNGKGFYTFFGTNLGALEYTTKECGDCTEHGGTNIQPPFWQ